MGSNICLIYHLTMTKNVTCFYPYKRRRWMSVDAILFITYITYLTNIFSYSLNNWRVKFRVYAYKGFICVSKLLKAISVY
jgi:hypothetical protein